MYQIQGQMIWYELDWADFVIWIKDQCVKNHFSSTNVGRNASKVGGHGSRAAIKHKSGLPLKTDCLLRLCMFIIWTDCFKGKGSVV